MSRYTVAAHHGESRSLFYVTDSEAPADEQPAVLMTCDRRTDADEIARDLEADHAARLARASQEDAFARDGLLGLNQAFQAQMRLTTLNGLLLSSLNALLVLMTSGLGLWLWTEVRSGVATVTAPVFEAFVPQMLNFESVGGVSFKKGCYPGQEVVARSQFRGTLKRRAFVVHCAAPLSAGQEVFHSEDPEQACGTIAQAAAAPDGGFDALLVMPVSAAQSGELHLGTLQGPALQLLELPYELLADI